MSAAATRAADPDDEITPEQRRQRREYDEQRRRRQRLEKVGFVFGTVQDFLALSDEEHAKVARWASWFPGQLSRDLVWRSAAREAAERLSPALRLAAGKLLRSCLTGTRYKITVRELQRSQISAYLWACPTTPEGQEPLLFIGFETPDAFWLLDICQKVDADSLLRWQTEQYRASVMGRSYVRLREVASQLAADLDELFREPYQPKRLPPQPPILTARAKRPPFKLLYSSPLRMSLRTAVLAAWKRVSGKCVDVRRAERNRIVNEYMLQSYGIKDAAKMLRLENVRRDRRQAREKMATDLLGNLVPVRALSTTRYDRQEHAPGSLFQYPAHEFLDYVWGVAKRRGRAYLSFVAVDDTRKGATARLCADLLLCVGGFRRQAGDTPLSPSLDRIERSGPADAGEILAAVCGASSGSKYTRGRGLLAKLEQMNLLRSERVGKHLLYELGDGPFTALDDLAEADEDEHEPE